METTFYFLVMVQIVVSLYLIWQGWEWLSYARRRMATDPGFYAPTTAVLCPCKGMEFGLERNLVSLTEFNHQNYELFFILAAASDPACGIIKRVALASRVKAHVIIAGKPEGCGEKVNNLRKAIEELPAEFEVLVFADSDGQPGKSWLHRLVAPLRDSRIGATTTMRWFLPNRNNLATALLAAWNAPVVTMLTEKGRNFCWGGGTAIRRSIFDQVGVLEEWRNSVSDDYSMTRRIHQAGLSIFFVPECLTASFVTADFRDLLEFTNRQILITRVYAEKLWLPAFLTHAVYCLTAILGCALVLSNLVASRPYFHLLTLLLLPVLLSLLRSAIRLAGVTELLPDWRRQIMAHSWAYIVLTVLLPFLYLVNFINSLSTRKIVWRGIRYELLSAEKTRVLSA